MQAITIADYSAIAKLLADTFPNNAHYWEVVPGVVTATWNDGVVPACQVRATYEYSEETGESGCDTCEMILARVSSDEIVLHSYVY